MSSCNVIDIDKFVNFRNDPWFIVSMVKLA